MSFHLVVTSELAPYKLGALITDPAKIEAVLASPGHRSVVKVFEQLTHVGVEKASREAAETAAPDAPEPHAGAPTL